jgi:hypothetical protein
MIMEMNDNEQSKHGEAFGDLEGDDFHQAIKIQIQRVTKETANLIGLLEGGLQKAGIDSTEYKMIREFGTTFLNDLVRTARKLDVQLQ